MEHTPVKKNTRKTKKTNVPALLGDLNLEAKIYTSAGKANGSFTLPSRIFGAKWNADLVHQVIVGMDANARSGHPHVKGRSEVRGGGRKPWKQKGTGRARHGSTRSPIWIGGGTTHGPRKDRSYQVKINRKMALGALAAVLSRKFVDGQILFVDTLLLEAPKTSNAKRMLQNLGTIKGFEPLKDRRHNAALLAFPEIDTNVKKSFRNFGNIETTAISGLNARNVVSYRYLVVVNPKESVSILEKRFK